MQGDFPDDAVWYVDGLCFRDARPSKHGVPGACHCCGQQQWGVNYWETCAPVANWASIRLLLALSHMHGLESRSIDFVLAFPQAVLETDVFMQIPQGFDHYYDGTSYVLKLKRSTHGLKQSNYNFYQKLSNALKSNAKQSSAKQTQCKARRVKAMRGDAPHSKQTRSDQCKSQ